MLWFVLIGYDKPGVLPVRLAHRPVHLEHLAALERAGRMHHAGAILDESGTPCGSVVVFAAESLAAAKAIVAADPFVVHGVFERYTVYETKRAFPSDNAV